MLVISRGMLLAGLASAAVLVFSVPALATITVTVTPASSVVELNGANDPLTLTLQISNPDQLAIKSWSFDLTYNPGVFQPIAGIGAVPTQGFEVGTYISSVTGHYNPNYEHNGVAPDVARAGVLNFAGTTGNAITGVLGKLALDAVGPGANTTISLGSQSQIILSTGLMATDVLFNSATVTVQTPEPGGMGLLLVGAMGLIRRKR